MLEIKDLTFQVDTADGRQEIIDHIDLTVEAGKLLIITGPNGGGKSTLARLIMGIEKPTSGRILFNGTDITDMDITQRARLGIGYAFQQPPRFKGMTVRRMLSLAHGSELPEGECCAYLTNVGLCSRDYLNRELDASLSGGEVKRIEIATLLARGAKLSIYDEPEAGIDLWSFNMLVDTFRAMRRRPDESIIIISHQERIMQLADEVAVIDGGRVTRFGPRGEVLPTLLGEMDGRCDFREGGSRK